MATITRNVTGRIFEAPPTCLAASCAENVGAVAAATIPRGAITFPLVRSARRVARNATSGRVSAPAMKPAGNKMISAGIRSRLAST